MDITLNELKIISDKEGFNISLIEKDYMADGTTTLHL